MPVTFSKLLNLNRTNINKLACLQKVPPIVQHRKHKDPDGNEIKVYDSIGLALTTDQIQRSWLEFEQNGEESDIYDLYTRTIDPIRFTSNLDRNFAAWLELVHDCVTFGAYRSIRDHEIMTNRMKETSRLLYKFTSSRQDREAAFLIFLNALEADYWAAYDNHVDQGYGIGSSIYDTAKLAWNHRKNRATEI